MNTMNQILAALILSACSSAACAQTQSVYGYDFVTIGDAGNRATTDEELTFLTQGMRLGAVDYEYRLATKEVTVGQWFEFVQAYAPIYDERVNQGFLGYEFTGPQIAGGASSAFIRLGYSENRAARINWEYAARYSNWLHNGKVNEAWAFDNGAYDTSTFTQNPDGTWNHQATRNPDAKFWIPTMNEWVKAAHWDPAKNGGEGGYWAFANGSDIEPTLGLPTEGGERNAGPEPDFPLDVGSYADVTSPWGLFDMAGGEAELLETAIGSPHLRGLQGSFYGDQSYGYIFSNDNIGEFWTVTVTGGGGGLRLAMAVPPPSTLALVCLVVPFLKRKRNAI